MQATTEMRILPSSLVSSITMLVVLGSLLPTAANASALCERLRDRLAADVVVDMLAVCKLFLDDIDFGYRALVYADRTLTKAPITPADQAEAYFLLVTNRLSKTTGQVITVDGGLHEAFLR